MSLELKYIKKMFKIRMMEDKKMYMWLTIITGIYFCYSLMLEMIRYNISSSRVEVNDTSFFVFPIIIGWLSFVLDEMFYFNNKKKNRVFPKNRLSECVSNYLAISEKIFYTVTLGFVSVLLRVIVLRMANVYSTIEITVSELANYYVVSLITCFVLFSITSLLNSIMRFNKIVGIIITLALANTFMFNEVSKIMVMILYDYNYALMICKDIIVIIVILGISLAINQYTKKDDEKLDKQPVIYIVYNIFLVVMLFFYIICYLVYSS